MNIFNFHHKAEEQQLRVSHVEETIQWIDDALVMRWILRSPNQVFDFLSLGYGSA